MFLAIAVAVLAVIGLYRAREAIWPRRIPPRERPPADPVRDALIITEFQRRRRVFLIAMAIFTSMFGYLYVVQTLRRQQVDVILGLPFNVHIVAAFAIMGCSLLVATAMVVRRNRRSDRTASPSPTR